MCSLVASRTSDPGAVTGDSTITDLHALASPRPFESLLGRIHREPACAFQGAAQPFHCPGRLAVHQSPLTVGRNQPFADRAMASMSRKASHCRPPRSGAADCGRPGPGQLPVPYRPAAWPAARSSHVRPQDPRASWLAVGSARPEPAVASLLFSAGWQGPLSGRHETGTPRPARAGAGVRRKVRPGRDGALADGRARAPLGPTCGSR
jgi:hypothetical protein